MPRTGGELCKFFRQKACFSLRKTDGAGTPTTAEASIDTERAMMEDGDRAAAAQRGSVRFAGHSKSLLRRRLNHPKGNRATAICLVWRRRKADFSNHV